MLRKSTPFRTCTTTKSHLVSCSSSSSSGKLFSFSLLSYFSLPRYQQQQQQSITCFSIPTICSSSRFCASSASSSIQNNQTKQQQKQKPEKKILEDGRIFEGFFDKTTGAPLSGTKLIDDGDIYVGEYNERWQRHGKGKAIVNNNSSSSENNNEEANNITSGKAIFEGLFEEDEFIEGNVSMEDENGDSILFDGTMLTCEEQEKCSGSGSFKKGTLTHRDYTYTGTFENDEPHGKGVLKFSTGAEMEGTFYRGKLHGENCKWRLESGQVYLGNFQHGLITSGELRTPTFTYEGEFNEKGQAHGVGRQEHHATSPKLIFTGHWASGSMVSGQCKTEDGFPVDWQNAPEAQDQLTSKSQQVMNSYMKAKYEDARKLHNNTTHKMMAEDAESQFQQTGKRPDAIDLGYDASPVKEAKIQQHLQRRAADSHSIAKERVGKEAEEISKQEEELKKIYQQQQKNVLSNNSNNSVNDVDIGSDNNEAPVISNWEVARSAMMKQRGKQLATADTIVDQFERFKLKKEEPSSSKTSSSRAVHHYDEDEDDESAFVVDPAPSDTLSEHPTKLRVDGNEPFVDTVAKTHRHHAK